jgi:tRNA(Ile2) C34 agmatinyltransferase TiaS
MAATATSAICEEQVSVRRDRRPCAGPRGVTLGQLLTRAHEAVLSGVAADCPACGGTLASHGLDGRCEDCGSRLS